MKVSSISWLVSSSLFIRIERVNARVVKDDDEFAIDLNQRLVDVAEAWLKLIFSRKFVRLWERSFSLISNSNSLRLSVLHFFWCWEEQPVDTMSDGNSKELLQATTGMEEVL